MRRLSPTHLAVNIPLSCRHFEYWLFKRHRLLRSIKCESQQDLRIGGRTPFSAQARIGCVKQLLLLPTHIQSLIPHCPTGARYYRSLKSQPSFPFLLNQPLQYQPRKHIVVHVRGPTISYSSPPIIISACLRLLLSIRTSGNPS
jgi:hypothetical protein